VSLLGFVEEVSNNGGQKGEFSFAPSLFWSPMFHLYFIRAFLWAFSIWLVAPSTVSATSLDLLQHQSWRARDGAPAEVTSLAQTRDGYLWLGTSAGLFRFNGVDFESLEQAFNISLLSNDVCALLASGDGGLWVGYRFGGVSHIREGKITHYHSKRTDGKLFPGNGSTRWLVEDSDGAIWATGSALSVFRNNQWQVADRALPRGNTSGMYADRQGGVWAGLGDGIYWKQKGRESFKKVSERAALTFFAQGPDGFVWALTYGNGFTRFDPSSGAQTDPPAALRKMLTNGRIIFDRNGNLWSASTDAPLYRIERDVILGSAAQAANGTALESMTQRSGLSGGVVGAVMEDREGNIWVGTSGGLDKFRSARVQRLRLPGDHDAVSLALAAADDGKVWLADSVAGLFIAGEKIQPADGSLKTVTLAYRAPSGRLWLGNEQALWLRDNGKLQRIEWPIRSPRMTPQAAVEEESGALWISFAFDGVYRLYQGKWEEKTPIFKGGNTTAFAMARDTFGAVWISYGADTLYRVNGGDAQRFSDEAGLRLGKVLAITPAQEGLWFGGTDAVMHYDGRAFRPLHGVNSHAFKGVSGIVATANGDLWLNSDDGIVHIKAAALSRWRASPSFGVNFELLNAFDGAVGKPAHARPLPTALQASDGRLWFTTGEHALVVDPATPYANALPPPVSITQVAIDGAKVLPGAPIVVPSDAQRIEIDFAGLSLAIPERNRYRYRLIGVERDWINVSARRSVAYTNLAPGDYVFEVMASNNDGVWSETAAQLRFNVQPAFHQTWWFRGAALLSFGLALWLLHHLRMQVITQRISERLQSQQIERVRIARELHDTLLQGVGSLSLMVHSAINKIDREHPVVPFLSNGLKQAESVIAEGRERVVRLRVDVETGDILIDELGMLGLDLTAGCKTRFSLVVRGQTRPIERQIADECRSVAREAIWNAVQHAHAASISLQVEFSRRALTLRIHDDGCGIAAAVLASGGREGHWGMPGMRERAERVGGRLLIQVCDGTRVVLSVPARLAYKKS